MKISDQRIVLSPGAGNRINITNQQKLKVRKELGILNRVVHVQGYALAPGVHFYSLLQRPAAEKFASFGRRRTHRGHPNGLYATTALDFGTSL